MIWSEDVKKRARELRKQNLGYRTISRKMSLPGLSEHTVKHWCDDIKVTWRNAYENGLAHKIKNDKIPKMRYGARKRLLRLRGRKCEKCGLTMWMGQEIPIEIHHINGDGKNHSDDNTQLLCPNCHAQTDTYKIKNRNDKVGMTARGV